MDYKEKVKIFKEYERYLSVKGSEFDCEASEIESEYKRVGGSQGVQLYPKTIDLGRSHPLDDRTAQYMLKHLKYEHQFMTPPQSEKRMSTDARYIYAPMLKLPPPSPLHRKGASKEWNLRHQNYY